MDAFSRAYRDPKSPLTPIQPFATNTAFSFNLGGDDSLKSLIEAIEAQRTTETPVPSPAGRACSIFVNPSKYTNRQPTSMNTKNVKSDDAIKTRKLSARYTSSKKSCMNSISKPDNYTVWGNMGNGKAPKHESTINSSCSGRHRLLNVSGATNCDLSTSSSSCCAATSQHEDNCRHRPPKLVFNDISDNETNSGMSSIFNWAWNRLSPMKNPSIYELLARVGMQEYWTIFKREEILDLDVFSTLTMDDLKVIGIRNPEDCAKILKSVGMALNFLSGLFVFKKP